MLARRRTPRSTARRGRDPRLARQARCGCSVATSSRRTGIPATDRRPTVWEATQHLIQRLERAAKRPAADLLRRLGGGSARPRASSPTASTRSASARAGRRRRSATTRSSSRGRRSRGSPPGTPAATLSRRWRSSDGASPTTSAIERGARTRSPRASGRSSTSELTQPVRRATGSHAVPDGRAVPTNSKPDVQFLLQGDDRATGATVFGKTLGHAERSYVGELLDTRNRWAHNEHVHHRRRYRALDTAQRLLQRGQRRRAGG